MSTDQKANLQANDHEVSVNWMYDEPRSGGATVSCTCGFYREVIGHIDDAISVGYEHEDDEAFALMAFPVAKRRTKHAMEGAVALTRPTADYPEWFLRVWPFSVDVARHTLLTRLFSAVPS